MRLKNESTEVRFESMSRGRKALSHQTGKAGRNDSAQKVRTQKERRQARNLKGA